MIERLQMQNNNLKEQMREAEKRCLEKECVKCESLRKELEIKEKYIGRQKQEIDLMETNYKNKINNYMQKEIDNKKEVIFYNKFVNRMKF